MPRARAPWASSSSARPGSALAEAELAFELLLPSEDAQLEEQVQALALWCRVS